MLLQTAGGVEPAFFKTLDDLVRHFKRKNQGLAIHLRHSVKRKTAMLFRHQQPPASASVQDCEDHDYESTSRFIFLISQHLFQRVRFDLCVLSSRCSSVWLRGSLGRLTDRLRSLCRNVNTSSPPCWWTEGWSLSAVSNNAAAAETGTVWTKGHSPQPCQVVPLSLFTQTWILRSKATQSKHVEQQACIESAELFATTLLNASALCSFNTSTAFIWCCFLMAYLKKDDSMFSAIAY